MSKTKHIELTAHLKRETKLAWLFEFENGEAWVPKSLGDYHEDDNILVVPEWFAHEKGLI